MPTKHAPAVSYRALQSELRRREALARRQLAGLARAHQRLTRKLALMEEQMLVLQRELGVKGSRRPSDRMRNDGSLADAIARVLGKRPMTIAAIMEAVNKSGYVSSSPNFRTMVTQVLCKDQRVKRAGRGLYQIR